MQWYLPILLNDPASINEIGAALLASITKQNARRRSGAPTTLRHAKMKNLRYRRAYK
ncbi:hypothetical protein ABGV49_21445 [Chromobacterium vaccinii]|uniref:Transposase n=1 Tax=Chromobacterium vaccinii TaxID=1108595 RepID=A0ABV0FI53_9NEIS